MKLIVDAMGGDNAPGEIVRGALSAAAKDASIELVFCGDEKAITDAMNDAPTPLNPPEIVPAASQIAMEDDPLCILKSKKDSSMAVGLCLLRDGKGDAFLTAGSTGALIVGVSSRIYQLKIRGVRRCVIGAVLPFTSPCLLLDSGANVVVSPEELVQFAQMGSLYMQGVFNRESPTVGLINNGAEETKGSPLYAQAHALLKEEKSIHFIGNVEGRDIPLGVADVLVCDGFVGNVILKLSEGFGKFFKKELKGLFLRGIRGPLAGLLLRGRLASWKESLSYEKYGAAPVLGTTRPVLKAHGSSMKKAIENAVFQAKKCYESRICDATCAISATAEQGGDKQ